MRQKERERQTERKSLVNRSVRSPYRASMQFLPLIQRLQGACAQARRMAQVWWLAGWRRRSRVARRNRSASSGGRIAGKFLS